jgi:hypothetical protein
MEFFMKLFYLFCSFIVCGRAQATTLIDKKSDSFEQSVYQFIHESVPYQSFHDDVIVLDMATGKAEKFRVSHNYQGEFYTSVQPLPMTAGETTTTFNLASTYRQKIDSQADDFWTIPDIVLDGKIDTQHLARFTFTQNRVRLFVAEKMQKLLGEKFGETIGIADNVNIGVGGKAAKWTLEDKTIVTVQITWTRGAFEGKIISLMDKYFNIIPITRDEAKEFDFTIPASGGDYAKVLLEFLKNMGATINWDNWGGNAWDFTVPAGNIIIIDCGGGQCSPSTAPQPK